MRNERLDALRLSVCVVLSEVKPVKLIAVMFIDVLDGPVHQPHRSVVSVGYYLHTMWDLGVAEPSEVNQPAKVVGYCPIHRYSHCVQGSFRCQNPNEQAITDSQFCMDVTGSGGRNIVNFKPCQAVLTFYSLNNISPPLLKAPILIATLFISFLR